MRFTIYRQRIDLDHNGFYSFLAYMFLFANLYRMISSNIAIYLTIMTIAGLWGYCKLIAGKNVHGRFVAIAVSVIFAVCTAINHLVTSNVSVNSVLQGIALYGISLLFVLYPPTKRQAGLAYVAVALLFTYYWIIGTHPSHVLSSSCNYISVILILFISMYYAAVKNEELNIYRLLPAVSCFFLSVWGRGRGGIFASGVLLGGLLLIKMAGVPLKRRIILGTIAVTIIIMSSVIAVDLSFIESLSWIFGSFRTEGFTDTARVTIWSEYMEVTLPSVRNIIIGTPLSDLRLISLFNSNPHNSFIYLHMTSGIFPSFLVLLLLVKGIHYYWSKKRYSAMLSLLVLSIRAFTDKFIFLQYGTPVMMYLLLCPMVYSLETGSSNMVRLYKPYLLSTKQRIRR